MPHLITLPDWAAIDPANPNRVLVDSAAAYTAWLNELEVAGSDVDQYWLEVAYQCIKLDLQAAMGRRDLTIKMSRAAKFEQASHAKGRGAELASRGREACDHFARVRGFLPA